LSEQTGDLYYIPYKPSKIKVFDAKLRVLRTSALRVLVKNSKIEIIDNFYVEKVSFCCF